ncbi:MAG: tetratricopeptide repeat protein [Deltaproteobacteria bacterium]|nr:tetratricopeptide repeat protein [Deltaproteobacteria bacterium]
MVADCLNNFPARVGVLLVRVPDGRVAAATILNKRRCHLSSQKDKFLASAQKYIQKGQFERALKDYEQVVTAEPKDVKLRQKLAELLIRCNRKEDAIREYTTIAKFYDENGYYLKSIAVYKQLQRLDPANIEISLSLATLNEKQGMIGNALSEYKTLYDHYQRQGQIDEAIGILQKMQAVDSENADIRLKLAETLFSAGSKETAYQEFTRAALTLKNRGNTEFFDRVCRKIHTLFPERTESSTLDILAEQLQNGIVGDAIPKLQKILSMTPDNHLALSLLSEAYRVNGDTENRKAVLNQLLDLSPGDISLKKNLILSVVEEGDLEGSIALLDRYLPELFSHGAYWEVENYYTTLQNLAPYDLRLLEGLKNLYELTGESAKLADVQVSLTILSQKEVSHSSKPAVDVDNPFVEETDAGPADSPWGDEIDLSLSDEIVYETGEETLPGDSLDFGAIELAAEDVTGTETKHEDFDIDISFELPDEDSDFTSQDTDIEAGSPSLDSVPQAKMVPEEFSFGDFGPEELSFSDLPQNLKDTANDFSPHDDLFGSLELADPLSPSPEEELPDAFVALSSDDELLSLTEVVSDSAPMTAFETSVFSPTDSNAAQEDSISPADIFARFTAVPKDDYQQDEAETHYNLGIAYMEMGLHGEAINEFRISANDPDRKLDSLTLQGICFRDRGNHAEAEEVLTALLSLEGLVSDRILALRYELGLLYEAAGRNDEALQAFREIFANNPGFRDTMKKIALLSDKNSSFDLTDLDDAEIELEELI